MDFPLPWRHWSLNSVVFAAATARGYIDVLVYPGRLSSTDERELDSDTATLGWLDKVCLKQHSQVRAVADM
jgi:hypothetical protein